LPARKMPQYTSETILSGHLCNLAAARQDVYCLLGWICDRRGMCFEKGETGNHTVEFRSLTYMSENWMQLVRNNEC
jgi:hypothetical protein